MRYKGQIKNGVVVLDGRPQLPEGVRVSVEVDDAGRSLADWLWPLIGAAEGLPSETAGNHDHYLHGRPKR